MAAARFAEPPCDHYGLLISMPTLLIGGERTPPPFPHILNVLERVLPNCKRVTIRKALHMMNVEQPEQFNAAVLDFVVRG